MWKTAMKHPKNDQSKWLHILFHWIFNNKQDDMQNLLNSYFPCFFILSITISHGWMVCQLMRMINAPILLKAWIAYIIIRADFTSPTLTSFNIKMTYIACCHKCRSSWVMQMVKDHHRGMFSPPQCVILIMISLTKTQKCLSVVKEFTLKNLIFILRINRYISNFNLHGLAMLHFSVKLPKSFYSALFKTKHFQNCIVWSRNLLDRGHVFPFDCLDVFLFLHISVLLHNICQIYANISTKKHKNKKNKK